MSQKRKIVILMLHLQHGGIERQTILFANQLVNKYDVEIISVYSMKKEPAYEVDSRIKVKYLIDDAPNKKEFLDAVRHFKVMSILKEGMKSKKILKLKHDLMVEEIKKLDCDFVLSTRIEYAEMLSEYAPAEIITMTQEHLHDDSEKYVARLKNAIRNLDYLVALGPGSRENYEKWFSDNNKIKIVEIPNILEKNSDSISNLSGHTLVSTGRMHPVKGFDDLLKVVKKVSEKFSDVKLNLIGGGEEYDTLKEQAKEMKIDDIVNMPGMVSGEEVNEYMIKSDIYVMTSHTECFPMVLLEASACGLPLVAFDVPVGPKALIKEGYNGYLIKDRDIDKMADRIINLFENQEKMKELGKNAKENVNQYLPDNVMKKWYDIFDK